MQTDAIRSSQHLTLPPPDGRPSEGELKPGESMTFFGDITIENTSDKAVFVQLHFDLAEGFVATIDGNRQMRKLDMHTRHSITPESAITSKPSTRHLKNINNFA